MQGCGKAVYVAQRFYVRAVWEDLDTESEELGYIARAVGVYCMVGVSTLNDSAGTIRRFIYAKASSSTKTLQNKVSLSSSNSAIDKFDSSCDSFVARSWPEPTAKKD